MAKHDQQPAMKGQGRRCLGWPSIAPRPGPTGAANDPPPAKRDAEAAATTPHSRRPPPPPPPPAAIQRQNRPEKRVAHPLAAAKPDEERVTNARVNGRRTSPTWPRPRPERAQPAPRPRPPWPASSTTSGRHASLLPVRSTLVAHDVASTESCQRANPKEPAMTRPKGTGTTNIGHQPQHPQSRPPRAGVIIVSPGRPVDAARRPIPQHPPLHRRSRKGVGFRVPVEPARMRHNPSNRHQAGGARRAKAAPLQPHRRRGGQRRARNRSSGQCLGMVKARRRAASVPDSTAPLGRGRLGTGAWLSSVPAQLHETDHVDHPVPSGPRPMTNAVSSARKGRADLEEVR